VTEEVSEVVGDGVDEVAGVVLDETRDDELLLLLLMLLLLLLELLELLLLVVVLVERRREIEGVVTDGVEDVCDTGVEVVSVGAEEEPCAGLLVEGSGATPMTGGARFLIKRA